MVYGVQQGSPYGHARVQERITLRPLGLTRAADWYSEGTSQKLDSDTYPSHHNANHGKAVHLFKDI
jgi:hypothetical protein